YCSQTRHLPSSPPFPYTTLFRSVMTPWDQGPGGVGQEGIYQGIRGAEKHVIAGAGHSTLFDATDEHNRVVLEFFRRHSRAGAPRSEEHTSELQSRFDLVCRLLLE